MLSQPPFAVDPILGEDNLPQQPLVTGIQTMPVKKFNEEQERGIDASLAYVEFLLARRKKKQLVDGR